MEIGDSILIPRIKRQEPNETPGSKTSIKHATSTWRENQNAKQISRAYHVSLEIYSELVTHFPSVSA